MEEVRSLANVSKVVREADMIVFVEADYMHSLGILIKP
jgi:hypothetical protein